MTLLAFFVDLITGFLGSPAGMREDLRNRNDRGKRKPDSEKYVTH